MKFFPELEEVKKIAADGKYRVLPVSCEMLSDFTTPIETMKILKNVSTHCYMLESAMANDKWGRYTFMGYEPKMEITCRDGEMKAGSFSVKTEDPSKFLRQILADYKSPRFDYLPPFTGGLVGYFSYDYLGYSEPAVRCKVEDTENFKDVDLMLFDKVIAFDHVRQKIILMVNMSLDDVVTYIAQVVADRAAAGNNFGTVLIPEGLIEFIPAMKRLIAELNDFLAANGEEFNNIKRSKQREYIISKLTPENAAIYASLPEGVARQLSLDRDPHGNVQVSLIETEKLLSEMVATKLAAWKEEGKYVGKFAAQHHFFGYEGRCAAPSNFDADYCYSLGYTASMLIANGKTGYMSSVRNTTAPAAEWIAGGVPITMMMNMERRHGEMKPVIQKALVKLDGAPFKAFAAQRETWAKETAYVYPGPIQYFGPTEVCDQPTKTLQLEQAK